MEANHQAELRKVAAIASPRYLPVALTFDDIAHKTGTIFAPDWLRRLWIPRLERLVSAWHDRDTVCLFHSDGNLWAIMDDLVTAGVDGLNPVETLAGMTVREVRERYPKLFMAGGIDVSELLPTGTPEEVRQACEAAIAGTGARGYLLGSTTLLHDGVPLANAQAMFETAWASDGGCRAKYEETHMTERLQVYTCEHCRSAVAVLRGGDGCLVCCGVPMQLGRQAAYEETPGREDLMHPPSMENNLNMTVKNALAFMQVRLADKTHYFGVKALKCPLDFWVYREILCETQPDVVVEIGNAYGGGALALAHVMDHLGKGRLIGLDLHHSSVPEMVTAHPRITFLDGDARQLLPRVQQMIRPGESVLVIEDSSHAYENTLNVLRAYGPLVTLGSYLIVEDSNCWHGVDVGPSPGPYEAVEQFLRETDAFASDRERESWFLTWNPKGYLKRVK